MADSPLPQWFDGSSYTHKVAASIMKYGPIARITLAQILGLSQGAISRITSDLIYAGVVEETPMTADQTGKLPKDSRRKRTASVVAVRRRDCASSRMHARSWASN